jgi:hypothetical protein
VEISFQKVQKWRRRNTAVFKNINFKSSSLFLHHSSASGKFFLTSDRGKEEKEIVDKVSRELYTAN